MIGKFLKTWDARERTKAEYFKTDPIPTTVDGQNNAKVAFTLSKRLIAVAKIKDVLHIEAGLEMIALAMAISSEVRVFQSSKMILISLVIHKNGGVFPESVAEVKDVLRRFEFTSYFASIY